MALRNAIMATLAEGESSGYDLSKRFAVGVANFWTASRQQLYRELDRMESDGLITARVVTQERRPTKRLFSLTEAGRASLRAFSQEPPRPMAIRDELLVQVEAVSLGDSACIRAAILARRGQAEDKLRRYEQAHERLRGGQTEEEYLASGPHLGPYLTLLRGISFERENIRWCDVAASALERRGCAGVGPRAAPVSIASKPR